MKTINLGIIGLGYIGQTHLRHSLKLTNTHVSAVADLSKKALSKAKKAGVKKTYTNYESLFKDPEIDAVIIGLPTHLHLQCAKKAAEAGKHIFLEKPIARNIEEAREIVTAAQRNSVKLMMGYPLRFNQEFFPIKEKITDGTLGDIEVVHAAYISTGPFFHRAEGYAPVPVPEWWFNKELTGGGVLIDLGSHIINLLRWYFGEIKDIKSCLGYRFNMDFEDRATCLTKFESGAFAVINVGWFSQTFKLEIELLGSVSHAIVQITPSHPILAAIQILTTGRSKFYESHFKELEYFINCLMEDLSPSPSGEDGLKDLEAISLAYKNQIHLNST
jgi:UDP-N-acetylglucosamine 3-dehydrogenase